MTARSLVVSVHDVSPVTREAVAGILGELAEAGVGRTSLLVIPDHHRQGSMASDPGFGAWLREMVAAGHEPVLHGYFHQRERLAHETARTRFVTRHYTADEGEFFDIQYEAARVLLTRGRDELAEAAGVSPAGFIAPAWLLSGDGEAAARDLGFDYTTRLKSVSDLATGKVHESQSLCWSVRSPWRRTMSLGWNELLFERLESNPLMRIAIHPPDAGHDEIWRQIQTLIARALEDRQPMGYYEFVRTP